MCRNTARNTVCDGRLTSASVTASLCLVQCKIDASGSMAAYVVTFCN